MPCMPQHLPSVTFFINDIIELATSMFECSADWEGLWYCTVGTKMTSSERHRLVSYWCSLHDNKMTLRECNPSVSRYSTNWAVGWVDIGIRTTVRLGKVHFVAKVCKISFKTFLVHWLLPHRCTLLGSCSTYGSKMIFSQYRVNGFQKTQNFT
jgi:hypothetical protein